MSELKKLAGKLKRGLGLSREKLTTDMIAEIERLGLSQAWFQWVVDEEGLDFVRFGLAQRTKEAALFEKWYPRLKTFVAEKRIHSPLPDVKTLARDEASTLRILEPKIRDAEHVPCRGNFTAAFFSAPLHVLPCVMSDWPSTYKNPVFLTPEELVEWRSIYQANEPDQDAWWFVFQDWDADWQLKEDSFWLRDHAFHVADGLKPLLVVCGMYWGSLAGGHRAELWGVDEHGDGSFIEFLADVTY